MKLTGSKHRTSNIEHPTSKDSRMEVLEFNDGTTNNRKYDLEERLLEFA
jgi:hypothetical protein